MHDFLYKRLLYCQDPMVVFSFIEDHSSHRKFKARPWSEMEKTAVLRHFRSHIVLAKIPKKEESEKCIKKEPCLSTRTWKNVKDFVRNRIISTKNKSAEVF